MNTETKKYQINITKNFDIKEMLPFQVKVSITFDDSNFKERIINLIKEKRIDIIVDQSYNHPIQIKIRKLFKLGYMDISLEEYCGRDSNLLDGCFKPDSILFSFDIEAKQNEAISKIYKVIDEFLKNEYEQYKNLIKYQIEEKKTSTNAEDQEILGSAKELIEQLDVQK